MKKEQMQVIIDQQSEMIRNLHNDIEEIKYTKEKELQDTKTEIEDNLYEQWKVMNSKFMKRFIAEMIQKREIDFDFETGYGGDFRMLILMGDEAIGSYYGYINMNRNGLDE
jgi:hypothetical protein